MCNRGFKTETISIKSKRCSKQMIFFQFFKKNWLKFPVKKLVSFQFCILRLENTNHLKIYVPELFGLQFHKKICILKMVGVFFTNAVILLTKYRKIIENWKKSNFSFFSVIFLLDSGSGSKCHLQNFKIV